MKRYLLFFFSMLTALVTYAYDQQVDGIYYTFDSNARTATVTYASTSYGSYSGNISVPEQVVGPKSIDYSVTAIGPNAFRKCTNLSAITLPVTIESIGENAFSGCTRIATISLPAFVGEIGAYAFDGCTALKTVNLPKSFVTAIRDYTFRSCSSLEQITIPSSVTSVGNYAFSGCAKLLNASLSTATESIGNYAFQGCSALTEIDIPAKVATIGNYAFDGCSNIASATMYDGITSIGSNAFARCTSLSTVTLPNTITTLGSSVFSGDTRLANVSLSTGLAALSDNLFQNCSSLTTLTIPAGVTSISSTALSTCSNLAALTFAEGMTTIPRSYATSVTTVKLPSTAETIDNEAFRSFGQLTGITIPAKVRNVGSKFLWDCPKVSSIIVENGNTTYDSRNNCNALVETATNELLRGCKSSFIPTTVTSIDIDAFQNCPGLASITIPSSVKSIGIDAFAGCSGLASLTYAKGTTTALRTYATSLSSVVLPASVTAIVNDAFNGCTRLSDITLPAALTSIGDRAFKNCASLPTVTFGEHLTTIGSEAFRGCSLLPAIVLPASLTNIGANAFSDCAKLTELEYAEGTKTALRTYATALTKVTIPYTCISFAAGIFDGCNALANVYIQDLEIWNYIFLSQTSNPFCCPRTLYLNGAPLTYLIADFGAPVANYAFANVKGLRNVTLTGSITGVGANAFTNSTDIENVVMGNSVAYIDKAAFLGCNNLQSLKLGSGVTTIGESAFEGCAALNSVRMGDNERTIGRRAFYGCSDIPRLRLSESLTSIGDYAFYGCQSLTTVNLPEGLTEILPYTFYGCRSLGDITFPAAITVVGNNAFNGCATLQRIELGDAVTTIGDAAFDGCTSIRVAYLGSGVTSIGSQAFANCTNLLGFYLAATKVPTTGSNAFSGSEPEYINLYVPDESVDAYKAKSPWSTIRSINGLGNAPVYATRLVLSPEVMILSEGDMQSFQVTTVPANATLPTVNWTSANTDVAYVSSKGIVLANAEGTTTVTAKAADGYGARTTATVIVTDHFVPLTSVRLDDTELILTEGDEYHLTATAQPASATYPTVRWQSTDERIATVSDAGVITALAPGNTTITARTADGTNLSATCTLTVEEPYYSTLATFGDADGDNVVSDRDIEAVTDLLLGNRGGIDRSCDVNGDGHIGVGDIATIIDLLQNGDVDGEGPEPVDMSISPAKATIVVTEDATCQLAVSFVPHRATPEIIWTSSNPEVATVNASGLVEARTLGSCIVTATTAGGSLTADVEIEVKFPSAIVYLHYDEWTSSNHDVSSTSSNTYSINYKIGDILEFDWSVSSESGYDKFIVTLDGSELLKKSGTDSGHYTKTFTTSGTATLMAKYTKDASTSWGDDQGRIYNIILKSKNSPLAISSQDLRLEFGETRQLSVSPALPVTWSSSNPDVVSVSSTGEVKALAPGESIITATWLYGMKATCKITVPTPTLTIIPQDLRLEYGESCQLSVSPAFPVSWSSSNPDVVSVSSTGEVKALAPGECIITATWLYGVMATCKITVPTPTLTITPQDLRLNLGESRQLSVYPAFPVTWSSSNPDVVSVSSTGEVKALALDECTITATWLYGAKAECKIYVLNNGHEWVDLGLSVKWATMNVGASRPEDYGNYFAWGETEPKSTYNMNTYFDSVNGSYSNFKKYNSGGKTTLDPVDDAAHVNWGGNWRMPTSAELDELRNNCNWTWTTQNGVTGYKVKSKSNGNSIFLPAAGYRCDDSLCYAASYGHYWSNSLFRVWTYANYLFFSNVHTEVNCDRRDSGHSVRAVCQ